MKIFCCLSFDKNHEVPNHTHAWTYLLLALFFQSSKISASWKAEFRKIETNKHPPQFIVTAEPHCKEADGTHAYALRKWFTQHLSYQEGIRCSNKRENIVLLKEILCSRKLKQYFYKLSSSCYSLCLDRTIFPSIDSSMNIN